MDNQTMTISEAVAEIGRIAEDSDQDNPTRPQAAASYVGEARLSANGRLQISLRTLSVSLDSFQAATQKAAIAFAAIGKAPLTIIE